MTRVKRRRRRDPIDHAMELALRLGDFIDYGAAWSFVTGLEEVEAVGGRRLTTLNRTSHSSDSNKHPVFDKSGIQKATRG
jgi:hypothetical protein